MLRNLRVMGENQNTDYGAFFLYLGSPSVYTLRVLFHSCQLKL